MLVAVLSGFGLSLAAPWIHRVGRQYTGWMIALLPLALAVYFGSLVPAIGAGAALRASYAWVPSLGVNLSFVLDGLSLMFALLITGIGALVMVYAGGYLAGDAQLGRFYAIILLFMAAMLGLVLADNLLTLFLFWELTSVSSYLLIGFKHSYEKARKAALQALLVTSMGGLALLAGAVLLGQVGGSYEISALATQASVVKSSPLYGWILALVCLGAFTKSAQFPFHFWLPGAMEAPAPVSSYLHSATMVKAGVYLLARMNPVLGGTTAWQTTLSVVGAVTLLVGAWLALQQVDLKRLLAHTTVAALGMLVLLIGVGTTYALTAAMMFLLAHALYKGALFMASGAIDHETGLRDVTALSGLQRAMPILGVASGLGALSMAGVPPFSGFVGKELAYAALLGSPIWAVPLISVAVAANVCMGVVAGLVWLQPFFGPPAATPKPAHEPPLSLWLGPVVLAGIGLVAGLLPGLAQLLVLPAAIAANGAPYQYTIKLWPGVNLALGLSVATIVASAALYRASSRVRNAAQRIGRLVRWRPAQGYTQAFDGALRFANWQTRLLQSGFLRVYTFIILVVLIGAVGYTFFRFAAPLVLPALGDVRLYEWMLALAILIGAAVMVQARSRLEAIAGLGVVGYGVALIFLIYSGPDLAMTQFAVETLSVILFVLVLYRLPRFARLSPTRVRLRDATVALAGGSLMTVIVLATTATPMQPQLARFFAENSATAAYGRNIVNVILVDFRGFDTFGEITVLATAAIGVYALLVLRPAALRGPAKLPNAAEGEVAQHKRGPLISLILSTTTRAVLPLMMLFAVVLLLRGHNEPGGGFIGGLVFAAAFSLYAIANGRAAARKALRVDPRTLVGIGLLVAAGSATLALFLGQPFMSGQWIATPLPVIGKAGTPVLFDLGVMITVAGIALTMIFQLMEE